VHELSLADYDFGRARRAGLLLVEADLLVEHAADWRDQPHNFSPELTRLLRYAEQQPASAYAAAARVVAAAHAEVARWWRHGEVMVLPTTPQTAFAFGTPGTPVPANQADLTSIANMAGVPALSVPLPRAAGELPVGLQFIAPLGHEATLLALNLSGIAAA
jgi:Asp-tRNA(Asn)/Glu-tRNA(Gln) amidotransferase A subunit family amidase